MFNFQSEFLESYIVSNLKKLLLQQVLQSKKNRQTQDINVGFWYYSGVHYILDSARCRTPFIGEFGTGSMLLLGLQWEKVHKFLHAHHRWGADFYIPIGLQDKSYHFIDRVIENYFALR